MLHELIRAAKRFKGRMQNTAYYFRKRMNWFDLSRNIDTGGIVDKENLYESIKSKNKEHMYRYVPTSFGQIEKALSRLIAIDKSILASSFVDFGCGKGRVLMYAERMGFRRIIGVEFSAKLCEICRANLLKIRSQKVEVVCEDATRFELKGDIRTFYFYNPFDFCVLETVLGNIRDFLKGKPYAGYIVYIDPRRFGQLNPQQYELLFSDEGPDNPFHIYRILV